MRPPGGVLRHLSFASFTGSGQTSIQSVATDTAGNVYVAGTTSSSDLPVENAAQPVFGEARILRSTDLGATWSRLGNLPVDISAVAPDPVAPQVLFAGGSTGIYKSADAGQTWRLVHAFASGTSVSVSIAIDPGNHLRVAALTSYGNTLSRSLDGGETWSDSRGPSVVTAGTLVVDPSASGALIAGSFGISISRDWGVTFSPLGPPGGTPSTAAFDPSHPGWIYVGTSLGAQGRLSLSTDFGATWTSKASPPTGFSLILNLAVDPDQSSTLVAATPDGFYKSTDGADSWTRVSAPGRSFLPEGHYAFALVSRRCSPTGGLFALGSAAAGTYQVAFSPDGGTSWNTPRLTQVTSVTTGLGCAAYVTRNVTTDAFAAKFAPDGTTLWSTFLGGSDADSAVALAVDGEGGVYITGNTSSPDFPSTAPRTGPAGPNSVFAIRLSADGKLLYSVLIGGEANNAAIALATDGNQNAYIAGRTSSQNFPVTPGVLITKLDAGSYTGFLVKLTPAGTLVYATYLGSSYTFPGTILVSANEEVVVGGTGAVPGEPPPAGQAGQFLVRLDKDASHVNASISLGPVGYVSGPMALAADAQGNLFLAGPAGESNVTPGAYLSPLLPGPCTARMPLGGNIYVTKLAAAGWSRIYSALLRAPCGIQPGGIVLDRSGAATVALVTGSGLALRGPWVGGAACSTNSSAIARINADGSALEFATYLDNCGLPAIASGPSGSLYVGASASVGGTGAEVLRLDPGRTSAISLDQIANAFSGDASAVAATGLYTLSGSGFSPPAIGLGLQPTADLPTQLGDVQVKFDGIPAAILQTGPGRAIAAAPPQLPAHGQRGVPPRFTAVQIISRGTMSNTVWMPIAASLPGLLSADYLAPQLHTDYADGIVRNADGTQNDTNHPASAGSTITIFSTGMGVTNPPVNPGAVARAADAVPVTPVFSSWATFSPGSTTPPEAVTTVPGYVSAMFQIRIRVPDGIQNLYGTALPNGVRRVQLGLRFQIPVSSFIPIATNVIGVYVK
jgi:uncharacterized protein (TIGR03437 family)